MLEFLESGMLIISKQFTVLFLKKPTKQRVGSDAFSWRDPDLFTEKKKILLDCEKR